MQANNELFDDIRIKVEEILDTTDDSSRKLSAICELLHDSVDHYDWVGFYMVDGSKKELFLGPFAGEPTEHVRIPFGRGICGRAAADGRTMIIQDITRETNYLACSPEVKSEIVIPIFKSGNLAGELDIDSRLLCPFTREDRDLLEHICSIIPHLL